MNQCVSVTLLSKDAISYPITNLTNTFRRCIQICKLQKKVCSPIATDLFYIN